MLNRKFYSRLHGIFFCLLVSVFLPFRSVATHIVGGELYYRYLGNSNYQVTLIVYRDCANGVPPFDDPASIGIFDNPFYNLVEELLVSPLDSITIPPTITSPCFIPPTNICYRQATYIDTVNLPPSSSGYWLVYQRCCRNITIQNIINPDDRGATYTAFIPGTNDFSQNSNPVYNNLPPPFICMNLPFVFDHSATDIDGDSIVYEICTPLDYDGLMGSPIPQPPLAPPYNEVPWNPPYSLSNVLGGTPMAIDPVTGIFTCTPSTIGQFVFGVCASEYRNGIYLSTTRRDYQVNVVPCSTIVVAAIQNPILDCQDNLVTFVNQSQNAGTYSWDFGDLSTNADTSSLFEPTYLYPDTGTYNVQLIAYSPINPQCNDTVSGVVYVYPGYEVNATAITTPCSHEVQFTDTTVSIYATAAWHWNFGDGTTSTLHNPSHIYSNPGNYTVLLTVTSVKGCIDTVTVNVDLNYATIEVASANPVKCFGECTGSALSQTPSGFPPFAIQWNDPLHQNTLFADSLCPGIYMVTVADSLGCMDSVNVVITEPPPLAVTVSAYTDYCKQACIGTALSAVTGGNGGYQYSWSDPHAQSTPKANNLCTGNYTMIVTDSKGCTDSISVYIPYTDSLPFVDAYALQDTIYQGQSTGLISTIAPGYTYNWTPSGTLSSAVISDPVSTPEITTEYLVDVTDSNGCKVSDTVIVYVIPVECNSTEIYVPNAFTPNGDRENDVLRVRGNTIQDLYIAIYDRWGEKVFETRNRQEGWDGSFKGKTVAPGVFVYYLWTRCFDNSEYEQKGNITVIR